MTDDKKDFVSGIIALGKSKMLNDFKHNGSFYKTTKRYIRIVGVDLCESDDQDARLDAWTPCEKLPF